MKKLLNTLNEIAKKYSGYAHDASPVGLFFHEIGEYGDCALLSNHNRRDNGYETSWHVPFTCYNGEIVMLKLIKYDLNDDLREYLIYFS